jgi:hypothetical protein
MSPTTTHSSGNLKDMSARTLHSRTIHSFICYSEMSTQTDSLPFLKDMSAQTLGFKRQPLEEMSGIFSTNLKKISRTGEEDTTLWRLAVVGSQMSSEAVGKRKEKSVNAGHWPTQLDGRVWDGDAPIVGEKRRAPDAPHTSHNVVSQEHGKGAGAAAQVFELAEIRRKKKKMDGVARNLPREERKMRAIMQRINDACDTGGVEASAQELRGEGEYSSSCHKTATAENITTSTISLLQSGCHVIHSSIRVQA